MPSFRHVPLLVPIRIRFAVPRNFPPVYCYSSRVDYIDKQLLCQLDNDSKRLGLVESSDRVQVALKISPSSIQP
jgi:hypothetical protein